MFADLVDIDGIGFAQDIELGTRDFTGAADCEARSREGVAPDEAGGQAEFTPQGAHFIFEKLPKRFNKLQPHFLGQATDIVM